MWMQPRVPLHVSAPAMARPQNTESADFRCSNGGVVASRKSDPTNDKENRRLTQNRHWPLPTTDAMLRCLYDGSTARTEWSWPTKPLRTGLTIDNATFSSPTEGR